MLIPHSRPWITNQEVSAVASQVESLYVSSGTAVISFEQVALKYSGSSFGIATSKGGAALELILRAVGLGIGDSVVLPSYVCRTVQDAIEAIGATPVYCDTSGSWTMTPDDVAKVIRPSTKAIILVHMFGIDASNPQFFDFGVPIIDDLCQAFGLVPREGRGLASFTSFHATKCLTTGEGGLAFTDNHDLFERMKEIAHARSLRSMSDVSASLGLVQLGRYSTFLERRKELTSIYLSEIHPRFVSDFLHLQQYPAFRFPLRVKGDFDELAARFLNYGIVVRRGVDRLLHRESGLSDDAFQGALLDFSSTISIPFHASLTESESVRVLGAVRKVLSDE